MLAERFAGIAAAVSARYGAPFASANLQWTGSPVFDAGGSITTPGTPVSYPCDAQISAAQEAMRSQEGFRETDVTLTVLAGGVGRDLDADATCVILAGNYAGAWSIQSAKRDSAGVGWTCRARKVV